MEILEIIVVVIEIAPAPRRFVIVVVTTWLRLFRAPRGRRRQRLCADRRRRGHEHVSAFRALHLLAEELPRHLQLPLTTRTCNRLSHDAPSSKKCWRRAVPMLSWEVPVSYEFTQNLQGTQIPSLGNSISQESSLPSNPSASPPVSPANLRDHTPWSSESRMLTVFRSSPRPILLVCWFTCH